MISRLWVGGVYGADTYLPRRQAGFVLCQLPLNRRSWHHTAQQILTSLFASATAALLWPMRSAVCSAQLCSCVSRSGVAPCFSHWDGLKPSHNHAL